MTEPSEIALRTCNTHKIPGMSLGDVYQEVWIALQRKLVRNSISSLEAFVHTVAYRASGRAQRREREQSEKHTPTGEECARKLARHLEIERRPSPRNPLDELIHQENCRRVRALLELLPEHEQKLLLTSISDSSDDLTLTQLADAEGVCEKTLQRRRKNLFARMHRELEG